jgi:ribonuclease-3
MDMGEFPKARLYFPQEEPLSSLTHENELQERIGYQFADTGLLRRALTHGSFGDGRAVADNERMEFLGDRVLGLIVSDLLFRSEEMKNEGQMARRLNALVRKEACAEAAREADLGSALYLSKAEEKNGGRDKQNILGDACEAILAALYLDGGMEAAKSFFDQFWAGQLSALTGSNKDPKSQLQEWALAEGHGLPDYDLVARTGPDHRPEFEVSVTLGRWTRTGKGASKQNAERAAAKEMIKKLEKTHD